METGVFLVVLIAALMHASWNAVVKGADDPLLSITHVMTAAGLAALPLLPLFGLPQPAVWPWLLASVAIHVVYFLLVVGAYRTGDMAQVYPVMRGSAPLMTAVASGPLLGEVLSPRGFLAVLLLSSGIFLMSLKGGRLGGTSRTAIGFALASAVSTCAYTLVDGTGARLNGSGPGYTFWMFALNMPALLAVAAWLRGREIVTSLAAGWRAPLGGGIMSLLAYSMAIWAMTKAPIALVAALRETSVLFATLIAATVLKEPITGWRIIASLLVVGGIALLRLA